MISPVPGGLMNSPRRWDFLATMMIEMKYRTFVEVGCKEGRTTGFILKNVPDSRVIAIDPWMKQEASDDPLKETYEEWDFSKIEKEFWDNVGEHKARCTMARATSEFAADNWSRYCLEPTVDLVFIDALHDYENVMKDISLWWPRVRSGGILAGHDFNHKWPGVERAVADHFSLVDVAVGFDSVWFVVKP
jgi:predicted O-methyltransferase YrrM